MKPNHRLRHERELRGWSQGRVAEAVGTTITNVSRWERGISFPYPYFREKLCILFDKTVQDLDLLPDEQGEVISPDTDELAAVTATVSETGLFDPAIPLPLPGSAGLVGRDILLMQLQQHVCTDHNHTLIALSGLPGVGKTALAIVLAHDKKVRQHFHNGILWAGLGPTPNILGILSRWGMLLGIPSVQARDANNREAWIKTLRSAIGMRRMLLIIDDAWKEEDIQVLKVGGPNCVHLMTTRFPTIAVSFAGEGAMIVPELSENDGLALLARFVPDLANQEMENARQLVHSVGALPLALTLMGRYLQIQAYSGQSRRLRAALQHLRDIEQRLHVSMPVPLADPHPSLPANTTLSMETVIEVSDQQLSRQAREALRALSVFPAKPDSFSEDVALAVTNEPVEVLDMLSDAGLLESVNPDRYMLHQAIADYARAHQQKPEPYERLITYITAYVEKYEKEYELLEQESSIILNTLEIAYERGNLEAFIRIIHVFTPFLLLRKLYPLAQKYLQQAMSVATKAGDTRNIAKTLLYQGRIAQSQGDYVHAEAALLQGLAFARPLHDDALISILLRHLGEVAFTRGDYVQADTYQYEGLVLARQLEDDELISASLTNLGGIARRRGNLLQAHICYQEALSLAHQMQNNELIARLLTDLGVLADEQGQYVQARETYQEALVLARKIGHYELIARLLTNLGVVSDEQGDYQQAQVYYQQALALSRQADHRPQMVAVLINLGVTITKQGEYTQAEAYYQEGLVLARQMGHRQQVCSLLINLGDVAYQRGDLIAAEAYFQEGLAISRQLEYYETTSFALRALGAIAAEQGNYVQAETYLRTGLSQALEMGHQELIITHFKQLGEVAKAQQDYTQAQNYYQEGLKLARELEHRELISLLLYQWGELSLALHDIVTAEATFREMLTIMPEGHQEIQAQALYGLARVAQSQGDVHEAQAQGSLSLKLLEALGHRKRSEVREWLYSLFPSQKVEGV